MINSKKKINNRILFLVDHKHRDLPSLALIGYFLKQSGKEVRFVALWQELPVVRSFNPGYIVLPKPVYDLGRLLKWKKEGRKIIVVDAEGNPQYKTFRMKIELVPDFYFFWNDVQMKKYKTNLEKQGCLVKVLGCPRSDFFHEKFQPILLSRVELDKQMGLSDKNFTITLASSAQDSHLTKKQQKMQKKRREKILVETVDYNVIVKNMTELRDLSVKLVKRIAQNFPDINLVIKPHPNENILFWQQLVNSLERDNIKLMVGHPIDHLLAMSDLNISFNVCTTTFESALLGIPTVELHTKRSKRMFSADHVNLADHTVYRADEIVAIINSEVAARKSIQDTKAQLSEKLDNYIKKYFFRFDGARCYEYAKEIQGYMTGKEEESSVLNFSKNLKLSLVAGYRKMKHKLKEKVIYSLFLWRRRGNNSKPGAEKKTDNRGRFDNRIKNGDENFWFEKFKKLKISSF